MSNQGRHFRTGTDWEELVSCEEMTANIGNPTIIRALSQMGGLCCSRCPIAARNYKAVA